MNDLYSKGTLKVSDSELTQIQEEFYGEFSNDEETVNAIKNVYKEYKYLMDPHTAVAYSVYDKLDDKLDKNIHTVIMSTAHPFKFPIPIAKALEIDENKEPYSILDDVSEVTGIELPKKLEEIRKEEIKFSKVIDKSDINNYVKEYIKNIK